MSSNKLPEAASASTRPDAAAGPSGPYQSVASPRVSAMSSVSGAYDAIPQEVYGPDSESARSLTPEAVVGGRYIIEERVGEGGMGRIFKVRHRDLGKLFALKIIHQNLAQQPHIRDAFYREARMAAAMSHPGIVSVIDFGVDPYHGAFIVMDYLDGETLAERLVRDEVIEPKSACDIMLQCAEALHFIHGLGVVHCDIKPENVFLCHTTSANNEERRNLVRLLDFGLASRPAVDAKEIVAATTVAGTPTYLSPERIRAEPPTPASDIYALGVLFYESLTGQPPFEGRLQDVLTGHLRRPPTPPSRLIARLISERPQEQRLPLDQNLEALVLRALAKEPAARHHSAAEFAFDLRQVMQQLGVNRRVESLGYVSSPRADLCESLVDACPLPMFVASPTGELLFGNAALVALLGIPAAELRGKLSSTLLGRWCPRIERDVRMVLARRRPSRHTLVVHNPQGEARGGWLTLAPYRRDGEVVGVCGVVAIMGDDSPS